MPPKAKDAQVVVAPLEKNTLEVCILGRSPGLISNRMSNKLELLGPEWKQRNAASRATRHKHMPRQEFINSAYLDHNDESPTYLRFKTDAFKAAMCDAALDIPGVTKSSLDRLTEVVEEWAPIYGLPRLFMTVVRQAGIQKTPDIRTRCLVPMWATKLQVSYVRPNVEAQNIARLMAYAGELQGVGDWRQGKGGGRFGKFEIVSPDDERWLQIMRTGGRQQQIELMNNPVPYDDESAEMLAWHDEMLSRGDDPPPRRKGKKSGDAEEAEFDELEA